MGMERKHYYAYNKTREAFLSLGVSVADQAGGSFWTALSQRELKTNEGVWISSAKRRRDAACSGPCDRIYLDTKLCVVGLKEGVLGVPGDPDPHAFDSVLLLPVHTIFGSQTQMGDQILIGTIEEIGAILEGVEPIADAPTADGTNVERRTMQAPMKWLARVFAARDRRRAARHAYPAVMAFYWDGGIPIPHAVPDISRTGLFLRTADRWHPRTLLRVTLQKRNLDPIMPDQTITIQCRVVRTGDDGVGMAFMLAEGFAGEGMADVGRLASRRDLNRFFDELVSDLNGFSLSESPLLPFPELSKPSQAGSNGNLTMPPKSVKQDVTHSSHAS